MLVTTLCYLEKDGCWLMLHRTAKERDVNKDKWIGVGGKFEPGESPEECVCREVFEETGYRLTSWRMRGVLTFVSEGWEEEIIFLFTADGFEGTEHACREGELCWVPKEDVPGLNLWEGDRVFLRLLEEDAPFFSLTLRYRGDSLVQCALNGKPFTKKAGEIPGEGV